MIQTNDLKRYTRVHLHVLSFKYVCVWDRKNTLSTLDSIRLVCLFLKLRRPLMYYLYCQWYFSKLFTLINHYMYEDKCDVIVVMGCRDITGGRTISCRFSVINLIFAVSALTSSPYSKLTCFYNGTLHLSVNFCVPLSYTHACTHTKLHSTLRQTSEIQYM